MMKKGGELQKRLKEARKAVEMTLKDAAKLAGFKHYQTLAKIEDGKRSVKAVELAKLADIYARDINFFLTDHPIQLAFAISWRRFSKDAKIVKAEHILKMLLERYLSLEKKLHIENSNLNLPLIEKQQLSYETAAELGEKYSKLLGLGKRPAFSLSKILEKEVGIPIFYLELPEGASAASIRVNGTHAICIDSNEAPWRRNFNLAHEFFHIVFPSQRSTACGLNNTQNVEKWANSFASGLLLPAEEMQKFMNKFKKTRKLPLFNIATEAKDFGVSTSALLWRIVNLGWIKRADAERLLRSESLKEKDRKLRSTISWTSHHLSHRFVTMVFRAISDGQLSRARAAEYLMVNIAELDEVFQKEGLYPDEDYSVKVSIT
jgi:Zn-dependent peptidase ImmA (M78 family)/DNA-binding XRE family transcriptional regulator